MAKLIYSAITSLDGYVADATGKFDWAAPDQEVHTFVNELERSIGTYLYGRRMYDVMVYWATAPMARAAAGEASDGTSAEEDYAAIWQAADKIVYSSTLDAVSSERTRLEREFDLDAVHAMKAAATSDISIGGPGLAAHAIRAGLVDEWHLFLTPVLVGGGTPALPDDVRVRLELVDVRQFGNGVMHLHYRTNP